MNIMKGIDSIFNDSIDAVRYTVFNEARPHVMCPRSQTRMFGTKWAFFFLKFYMKGTFHGTRSTYLASM